MINGYWFERCWGLVIVIRVGFSGGVRGAVGMAFLLDRYGVLLGVLVKDGLEVWVHAYLSPHSKLKPKFTKAVPIKISSYSLSAPKIHQ
jgi:hypothetical protein